MKCQIIFRLLLASIASSRAAQNNENLMKISEGNLMEIVEKERHFVRVENRSNQRIVGGNVAPPHSFPYQVALFITMPDQDERVFCGGSLLNEVFVLTAAHCVSWNYVALEVEIVLGAQNVYEDEPTQKRYKSVVYYINKGWNPYTLENDIAIVRLPQKTEFTAEIKPIRLPKSSDQDESFSFEMATVSGWGAISDNATGISPVLRYMETRVTLPFICKLLFFGRTGPNQICVDGYKKSSCNGDSGGPVVLYEENGEPVLHGIVSFGIGFGCEYGWPHVNTKVSKYLKWIYEHTGIPVIE